MTALRDFEVVAAQAWAESERRANILMQLAVARGFCCSLDCGRLRQDGQPTCGGWRCFQTFMVLPEYLKEALLEQADDSERPVVMAQRRETARRWRWVRHLAVLTAWGLAVWVLMR